MKRFDLDEPLIRFASSSGMAAFRLRSACEGVLCLGGIGSGKSSGSGALLARKYLSAKMGGLVLCTKPDEKAVWQAYCRQTGRENDLIILEPGSKESFNFLEYESSFNNGRSSTDNIVSVLKTVIRAGEEQDGGQNSDSFWGNALDLLMANTIDLCKLAYGRVTIQRLYDIVQSIPKNPQELHRKPDTNDIKPFEKAFEAARKFVNAQVNLWQENFSEAERKRLYQDNLFEMEMLEALPDARLFKMVDGFFADTLIHLSEKTRSVIDFIFNGFLFRLLRDPIYSLFCRYPSTVTPEDCLDGRIILINLPVKEYEKPGRDAQILFKYCWQRAMEKRNIGENERPVFLFADECQFFLHESDQAMQTTARSSRICTVYLTQNLPNLYTAMGGGKSEYRVKAFLGTLATKFFHANSDIESNRYASELIGDAYFIDETESITVGQSFSQSAGRSRRLERVVRPEEFVSLLTGGPLNLHLVEAYMYHQGDSIMNGHNHLKVTFDQEYQA